MKKIISVFILIFVLSIPAQLVSAQEKGAASEVSQVIQVIEDFYTSINENDSQLYLKSIAHPQSESNLYNASQLKVNNTSIEYEIIDITKINELKYEVKIQKTQNGIDYPVIPYDVILQDNVWKFDPSNIIIYPKNNKLSTTSYNGFHNNVISENENFIISKNSNDVQLVIPFGSASYNFNTTSTDIYFSGTATVKATPRDNDEKNDKYNWVLIEVLEKLDTGELYAAFTETVSAFDYSYTTFTNVYGYHKVKVYNFNYPWLPGTFTVGW